MKLDEYIERGLTMNDEGMVLIDGNEYRDENGEAQVVECPHCEEGDLHPVLNQETDEQYYWCNLCTLSMDSDYGYIV